MNKQLLEANFDNYNESLIQNYLTNQLLKVTDIQYKSNSNLTSDLYFSADFTNADNGISDNNGVIHDGGSGAFSIDRTKKALKYTNGNEMCYFNKSTALDLTKGCTMNCWYYRNGEHNSVEALIAVGNNHTVWWTKPFGIISFNANGNKRAFPMLNSSAEKVYTSNDLNRWVFIAGTISPQYTNASGVNVCDAKLYIDDSLEAQLLASTNLPNFKSSLQNRVYIGNSELISTIYTGFKGWIKFCKIWNRELTQDELLDLYNTEKTNV